MDKQNANVKAITGPLQNGSTGPAEMLGETCSDLYLSTGPILTCLLGDKAGTST